MTIEEAVKQHALAHPGLAALIGDRLHYGALPDGTVILPALVYFRFPGTRHHVTDKRSVRFQFTAWAADYPAAAAVIEQVEDAFIRYRGMMAGVIPVIQASVIVSGYDFPPETVTGMTRFGRASDIMIHYKGV